MVCKNLKELEKELQKRIDKSLLTDVTDAVRDVMTDHIYRDVYDAYLPIEYGRRLNEYDGLGNPENIIQSIEKDVLVVENYAKGSKYHRVNKQIVISDNYNKPLAPIVEYGGMPPYEHLFHVESKPCPPRPFIANTREDLKNNKYHVEALKRGLKSQGLEVE